MKHFRVTILLLTSVLVVWFFGVNIRAQAQPSSTDKVAQKSDRGEGKDLQAGVEPVVSEEEQANALEFWSRNAIAEASPLLMIDYSVADDLEGIDTTDKNEQVESAFTTPSGLPDVNADQVSRTFYADDWNRLENDMNVFSEQSFEPYGTNQVHTSYTLSNSSVQRLYPHLWVGRFTFRVNGVSSSCSATSISNNHVLTAAHCVYDTANNRWHTYKAFSPAYRNGSTPYGTFATTQCKVLRSWVNLSGNYSINSWARHDVAVCKVGRNSANQTLNGAVGWMGRQTNGSSTVHAFNMGYPARDYKNQWISSGGQYLRACVAETSYYATDTRRMGCYWGPGISGGPWVINYSLGNVSGNATGVNSGMFFGTQNMYGARFTSSNLGQLCTTGWC